MSAGTLSAMVLTVQALAAARGAQSNIKESAIALELGVESVSELLVRLEVLDPFHIEYYQYLEKMKEETTE